MRRCFAFALLMFYLQPCFCQSYGLTFASHETALETRTSLDISPDDSLCLAKNFEVGFDMRLIPNQKGYFGYVLRIISNGNNIDLIYDQKPKTFKVIVNDQFSNIRFSVDSPRIYDDWNHFSLTLNLENQTLKFIVNGKSVGSAHIPSGMNCYKFLWGANDYEQFATKDMPPMQIKDVGITEHAKLKYFWPLDQTSGDSCYDWVNKQLATVKNPTWIKHQHQYWQKLTDFFVRGDAGVAYNPKQDKLYVIGYDSIFVYSVNNQQDPGQWMPSAHINLRLGNQAIYDTMSDKLYDIFVDQHRVVSFDFNKRQWSGNFDSGKITEFWHFNKFISPWDSCIYVVGGYGQNKYKNLIQRYSPVAKRWEQVKASGDYFSPRFRAALGIIPQKNAVYILGGYGSKSGDQMLAPENFYDLINFNFRTDSFKTVHILNAANRHFTFANSLVINQKSDEFYGLIYANDSSNSSLQLIKSSFSDPNFVELGDAIPFRVHDIESFCDLYYSNVSNKLLAVVLRNAKVDEKNRITQVEIYSLNFPPATADITPAVFPPSYSQIIYWLLASVLTAAVVWFVIFKFRRHGYITRSMARIPGAGKTSERSNEMSFLQADGEQKPKSSIYLFGQFQVFDHDGNDITGQFSPLLKELFLLMATVTIIKGRGIASAELDDMLWHDKAYKDAKNNRAVNIAKLKALLEKIGNFTINKEAGFWQLQLQDDAVYMDLKRYKDIVNNSSPVQPIIYPLIALIGRGAFLYQTEYSWLDDIKADISNTVIDLCLNYLKNQPVSQDTEFRIEICNCIFHFDQLNEDALTYKCKCLIYLKRHTLASNTYLKFIKDYRDIYGTSFSKSFQQIID